MNPAIISFDIDNYIDKVVNRLFKKQFIKHFFRFFNGISNNDKKIKIYFRRLVGKEFWLNVSLIHWLENSKYSGHIILSLLDINRVGREYWKNKRIKIYHFPIITRYKIFIIKKSIIEIIRFFINYPRIKIESKKNQRKDNGLKFKKFRVMFFPHKSVFYGDLFLKDHFYSKDKSSFFHPRNIIHIEYDNIDIKKAKIRFKEQFGFEPNHINLDSLKKNNKEQIIFELLKCIDKELVRSIVIEKISFRTLRIMARLYYGYLYYFSLLQGFQNAKIALVGYDALFPVTLSLALERKGIKTIGVQERFMHPSYNNTSYVLNTQYTVSNHISSLLQDKQEFIYVSKCIPTGLIRSDKLINSKARTKNNPSRKKILVFDYPVENNYNYQIFQPVINWKNDRFFKKEIIKIAKDFEDYDFIIRGKNIEWTKIEYYHDILDEWNNTPNIFLDVDYSEFYRTYELCNNSDLIIARYTSIADECISKGYDVIIHDYGINYDNLISNCYPFVNGINFCHSYEELKDYMIFFQKKGFITEQKLKNEIMNLLFDNLSDGKVQERLTKYQFDIEREILH